MIHDGDFIEKTIYGSGIHARYRGYCNSILGGGIEAIAKLAYIRGSISEMNTLLEYASSNKIQQIDSGENISAGVQSFKCNHGHVSFGECKTCQDMPNFVRTGVTPFGCVDWTYTDVHRDLSQKIHYGIRDYVNTFRDSPWWVIASGINEKPLIYLNFSEIIPPRNMNDPSPPRYGTEDYYDLWEAREGGTIRDEAKQADNFMKKLTEKYCGAVLLFYYSENSELAFDPIEKMKPSEEENTRVPRWSYCAMMAQSIFESKHNGKKLEKVIQNSGKDLFAKATSNLKILADTGKIPQSDFKLLTEYCKDYLDEKI